MPGENIQDWSTTSANNGNSDSSINWAEGQSRASVNNSARSMMAAHAKQRNLLNGSIVTGGSANAQTFFSGLNYTTIPTGLRALLKIGPGLTNTGAATLEMDGLGAVAIIDNLGGPLGGGELIGYQQFRWDGTNWVLMNAISGFSTGDVKLTIKIIADPGWLMMDDLTIGSAASGAATASAGTQLLFNLLFNNLTDTWAPIYTSAGAATTRVAQAAAATAWAADCRMALPKVLGRALASAGAGSGLVTREIGSTAGADTETPTEAKTAVHGHGLITYGAPAPIGALNDQIPWGHDGSWVTLGTTYTAITSPFTLGLPLNIRDPSLFLNVMIKL